MKNVKIIINNPYDKTVNLSSVLSQFSVEGDQFRSQKGGESVAKVYPFCQKTNIIFVYYFLSIMPVNKKK
jgi:hypothetical protein